MYGNAGRRNAGRGLDASKKICVCENKELLKSRGASAEPASNTQDRHSVDLKAAAKVRAATTSPNLASVSDKW